MKLMRYIILFLLGISLSRHAAAQTNEDYFLLGTFSDSKGIINYRDYIDTTAYEVDYYYPYEKMLARFIRNSVIGRYGYARLRHKEGRYHLYSRPQFKILDLLYLQSNGLENDNIFATKEQALSYLHGVYLRFGYCGDSCCFISVSNSGHGRLFYKIAKSQGFTDISIKELDNIPHVTYVYFTPTSEFLRFIDPTAKLKKKLIVATDEYLSKIYGEDFYMEYMKDRDNRMNKKKK